MTERITSPQNARVKQIKTLQTKARARRGERRLVLEGVRLISDALGQGYRPETVLYLPERVDYDLIGRLQSNRMTSMFTTTPEIMRDISDTQNAAGIIAVFPIPKPTLPIAPRRMLILDAIREPGNLGTLLRTAAAAGVELVVLAPDCVDAYNPKVMRGGMGAHFRLPIVDATWPEIAAFCADMAVYLAAGEAETVYTSIDFTQPWALVVGNEAHGAGEAAHQLPNLTPVRIPLAADTESLNAAIAAAVILFEAARQNNLNR